MKAQANLNESVAQEVNAFQPSILTLTIKSNVLQVLSATSLDSSNPAPCTIPVTILSLTAALIAPESVTFAEWYSALLPVDSISLIVR